MVNYSILVGEGKSERFFFPSLLQNSFGFQPLSQKNSYLLVNPKTEKAWLCPFPPGKAAKEGKSRLYLSETYRIANAIMKSNQHHILQKGYVKKHLRVLHDIDVKSDVHVKKCEKKITDAYDESRCHFESFDIVFVCHEIESWYLAGLSADFHLFDQKKEDQIISVLKKNPDSIIGVKEVFYNLLEKGCSPSFLAVECGLHFSVEKAIKKSESFAKFIYSLEEII